MKHSAKHQS